MKRISILIIGITMLLFLAACGDDNDASSEGGVVELTLWNDWTEDRPENTVYKDIIGKFNEEHDDINIIIESIPHADYEIKLRTQAAGKQLPDMMRVWPGARTAPLVEGGALLPLNEIIDNWDGVIPDEILQDYAMDGNYYAIPSNISETSLIFYNKKMVEDAGYEKFPATYEELETLIESLNSKDITPIALGNKDIWPLQSVYISTIADRYTGSSFLDNVLNGDGSFVNEQFIDSLSVIDGLAKLNAFNEDFNTIDEAQARNQFIKGSTAMHFAGSWAIGPIIDSVEDIENIGVAPLPSFEGGEGDTSKISGVAGGGIAVNSSLSEEEQEAAFKFLEYYYSDDLFQELVKANIIVPADVEMDDSIPQIFQDANGFAQYGLAPVYDATLPPEVTDVINNGLQALTIGQKTAEELANEMQEKLEQVK